MEAALVATMAVSTISPWVVRAAAACIPVVRPAHQVMLHPPRLVMTVVMVMAGAMVVEMVAVTVVETVEAMAVVTAAVMVVETVAVMAAVMAVVTATATATVMATVILLVMVMARPLVTVKAARALPCPSFTRKAERPLSLC